MATCGSSWCEPRAIAAPRRLRYRRVVARYEFSEGTSSKFWDIQLSGSSFTTTWGKIGTTGQAASKSFATDDKARQEHDKLIAEKVRKGYVLVSGGPTSAPAAATVRAVKSVTAKLPAAPAPVMTPTVSVASAITVAVRTSAPPPASPRGAVVTMTEAAKKRLAIEQRALAVAPRTAPSMKVAYKALTTVFRKKAKVLIAEGLQGGDAESREAAKRVLAAFGADLPPKEVDVELATAALMLIGVVEFQNTEGLGLVVDFLVAHGGLGFALEAFVASLGDRDLSTDRAARRWLPNPQRTLGDYFHDRTDRHLQAHWLGLDDAGRATARAAAEALRAEGSLLVRSALASALLIPAWIDQDLADAAARGERAMFSAQALVGASHADAVAAYFDGLSADDARFFDREPAHYVHWYGAAAPSLVVSLLAHFGVDGVRPLAARVRGLIRDLDPRHYYAAARVGEMRAVLEAMRCVSGRPEVAATAVEVFRAVDELQVPRDEDARPIARDCLLADPHVALPLVREHARAGWAKELLPQLERLLGGSPDVEHAEVAELPPSLRTPAPAKTKFPEFWNVALLPPLRLISGKAVPPAHLGALVLALRDGDTVGLRALRDAADRRALAAFGWELFQLWQQAGAPPKEKWAFLGLGALGNDETARRLTPLIRAWPGESQHARATLGLDVLGQIGTDVALMMLNGIAQKLKFKGLQERAREKMGEIAAARGITAEQLADRLVPDLDLEDDGSKTLDFGPRSFRVGFDEALAPFVMDAAGTRLKDLPKPNSKDDAVLAPEASEIWKAMKKDARAVASIQLTRLELAMGNARRWSPEEFRAFFVEHPLLSHVVKRLVWATYDEADAATATFRVAEDRSYADRHDDAFALPDGARVGIAHRLHLTDDDEQAWRKVFADYELIAPFAQLGREVFRLTPTETAATSLARFAGQKVETRKLLGLLSRGWFKGPAQDAGCIFNLYKPLEGGLSAALAMDPGINAGGMEYVEAEQVLDTIDVAVSRREWSEIRPDARVLGALPAVVVSEVIRDVASLGATP